MTILAELKTDRAASRTKLKAKVSVLRAALTGGVAVDPTSLARKVTTVEQFWTSFDAAHRAYLNKLNPDDDQLEIEMEYWTTEDTATEEVLEQARAKLDIANAPAAVEPPPPPDNSAGIQNLKAELEMEKEIIEQELAEVERLIRDADHI